MQRVLTAPLGPGLRLEERLAARGPLRRGERARLALAVRNLGASRANEVVVNDRLPPELEYVRGSARRGGAPVPDVGGHSPFAHGPAQIGRNVGSVPPGASVELSYEVRARRPIADAARLALGGRISSREDIVPHPANPPPPASLEQLRERIGRLPGVGAADELAFAELSPGSLRSASRSVERPVKVFGFDRAYLEHYPAIRLAAGSPASGSALLSPEAARALGARPGSTVVLRLPGGVRPLRLRVGGVADLSRARALFDSRKATKLEDFLYVPDSVVISPRLFEREVVSAFRRAIAARGRALGVKSPPTLEVDVPRRALPAGLRPGRGAGTDPGGGAAHQVDCARPGLPARQRVQRAGRGARGRGHRQAHVPVPRPPRAAAGSVPGRVRRHHPRRHPAPRAGQPALARGPPRAPAADARLPDRGAGGSRLAARDPGRLPDRPGSPGSGGALRDRGRAAGAVGLAVGRGRDPDHRPGPLPTRAAGAGKGGERRAP